MKKISQKELADYLKLSQQLICYVKKKRRKFGRKNAKRISALTSVPFKDLMFLNGETLIEKLCYAYCAQNGGCDE